MPTTTPGGGDERRPPYVVGMATKDDEGVRGLRNAAQPVSRAAAGGGIACLGARGGPGPDAGGRRRNQTTQAIDWGRRVAGFAPRLAPVVRRGPAARAVQINNPRIDGDAARRGRGKRDAGRNVQARPPPFWVGATAPPKKVEIGRDSKGEIAVKRVGRRRHSIIVQACRSGGGGRKAVVVATSRVSPLLVLLPEVAASLGSRSRPPSDGQAAAKTVQHGTRATKRCGKGSGTQE